MKTLKEITAESKKYSVDREDLQDAFVAGARFALTGKYYRQLDISQVEQSCCRVPAFDDWWNAYSKKRGRKKAEAKWDKLSPYDKLACMRVVLAYVDATPDPLYRKDPLTYLNGECWNDEIITKQNDEHRQSQRLAEKAARILGAK